MNLVGNAIKFTEQGSVTLMATITCESAEPRLLIEVRDTGIGIPQHRIEGIFNPFEQADSSITRRFGGTGLGLAISRHIAQGLGGEIDVQSVHGLGTVFRIQLATGPLQGVRILDEPPTEAIINSENGNKESLAKLPADCRVLLVEDGESNQQLISLVLREAGAHVTCAWNGEEGVTVATRTQFDLILMDMQMPVMDGYTATECLRKLGCTVPIIALTAHAMRGDREKCLAAGCTDYLTKPIDIDALIRTVAMSAEKASTGGKPTHSIEVSREQNRRKPVECSLPADNPRFRPIIDTFVVRLQKNLAEMQTAFTENDWKKVAELAHWLRGSGGTVGFNCFTEPSGRLEVLAKARDRDEAQRALEEIASLSERIALPV
jgi:CheY-like chemotaxis protein